MSTVTDELTSDLASLRIDRDAERPRPRWRRPLVLLLLVGALGWLGYAVGLPYLEGLVFKTEVKATEVSLVSSAQASVDLTATGYVVPQIVSKVGAKVPGRIAEVTVKEGDTVKKGAMLVRLEDADRRSAIAAANARVAAARAKVLTARAQLLEQQQKAERQRKLRARGVAAAATVEDLEARVRSVGAQVKAAEADVAAARAQVTTLRVDLDYARVLAPIDGTVISKPVEVGEAVEPSRPLLELADLRSMLVEVDVPEARLHLVKADGPCEIVLDAFSGRRFRGAVVGISPKVNRAKATAVVKVRFVDELERVLPEMAARVSFLQRALDKKALAEPPKLVVPAAAIAERGGARIVFVIDGDKVRMRPVTLGAAFGGGFELKQGPAAGTRLVRDPPEALADGQRIKLAGE